MMTFTRIQGKLLTPNPTEDVLVMNKKVYDHNTWVQSANSLSLTSSSDSSIHKPNSMFIYTLHGALLIYAHRAYRDGCRWPGHQQPPCWLDYDYCQICNISHTKSEMFVVSSWSCLCPIHWSHVISWEWRCSWSSAGRRCSNYIWVINNFIAYWSAPYIRDSMIYCHMGYIVWHIIMLQSFNK